MSYRYFSNEELKEKYDREKEAVIEFLLRNPTLSQDVVEKLVSDLREMNDELERRKAYRS